MVAVTLKLWADQRTDGERSCCSPEAVLGARRVAHSLGIPHLTLDLEDEFRAGVVDPFLRGYAEGRTPNPCVLCNGELRIDAMIALADRLGAAPARQPGTTRGSSTTATGRCSPAAADAAKDQTYMLSGLRPGSLARLRFPLGRADQARGARDRRRARVSRSPAARRARTSASSPARASASSCAGTPGSRSAPGEVVDRRGRRLGAHDGHHNFTVGQRRGLGVGGGEPLLRPAGPTPPTNTVVAGTRERARRPGGSGSAGRGCTGRAERVDGVRLRYHSPRRDCRVEVDGDPGEAIVALAEPVDGAGAGAGRVPAGRRPGRRPRRRSSSVGPRSRRGRS